MAVPATATRVPGDPRFGHIPAFVALSRAGFRRYATYRQATAASAFTNSVFGFLRCSVLLAVVAATEEGTAGGYTPAQIATYCWASQGLIGVVMLWGFAELSDRIRTGHVVSDLLRPMHPVASYLATDFGRAAHACLTRFVVPVVVGAIFFELYVPRRWTTFPLFVASVVLGVVVCFGCRYLINAAAFWILDVRGLMLMWSFATACMAGLAFPLHFLPTWLVTTLWVATPFPSILQAPLDVVVERGTTAQLAGVVAGQAAWAVVLLIACVYVQKRAERKLVIQKVADLAELRIRAGIYRRLLGAQVRSHSSYRASFVLDLAANGVIPIIDVATVFAMFAVTRTLGGFSAVEVLVMYGLCATTFATADLFVGNIERIRSYVHQGMLDAVLVRPLSVLGQLVSLDFTIRRVARIVIASLVLGLALSRAGIDWSAGHAALLVVALVSGTVFFCAVFVTTATIAFWWIDSGEFANGFTYGGRDFTAYPITVYNGFFRGLFAYALGFGFVAYYPALGLLGRSDTYGLPGWVAWCGPLFAAAAAGAAAFMWRLAVRRYRSTGS